MLVLEDKIAQLQRGQIRLWCGDWVRVMSHFLRTKRVKGDLDQL